MTTKCKTASPLKRVSLLIALWSAATMLPAAEPAPAIPAPAEAQGNFSGKVVEAMDADHYTYVQVDTGHEKVWAATQHLAVAAGDPVKVIGGMPMVNFHSKTLNRDFALVYFTGKIVVNPGSASSEAMAPALPPGHPAQSNQVTPALPPNHPALVTPGAAISLAGIKKAAAGQTVQEIIFNSAQLAGRLVTVRGKVVKYNAMVMGKNWLHIQDGSGSAGKRDNDLTITTDTPAKLGDTVLVTGRVSINKDFGSGYKFAVILDDAQVKVE